MVLAVNADGTNDGKLIYLKRAKNPQISSIESGIYHALEKDLELRQNGIFIATVSDLDEYTLTVTDCGPTLADYLHSGRYKLKELRDIFIEFLGKNVLTRKRVNEVIEETLTAEDRDFLDTYHLERLVNSMKEISSNPEKINTAEVRRHFWAYRVMNALGIDDEQFKEAYTELIGNKLDAYTIFYGQWISDNTLRNNASRDGKVVVPFDFDSIKFGPAQIDAAAVAGLYLFDGPLGMFKTKNEATLLIESLRQLEESAETPDQYLRAFILSSFHENAVIAGYRTMVAKRFIQSDQPFNRSQYLSFRNDYDEIEYHSSASELGLRNFPEIFVGDLPNQDNLAKNITLSQRWEKMQYILETIQHRTFGQRILFQFSPRFQEGENLLFSNRT